MAKIDICCEMELLTAIVPVLTTCAALNRVFCGFGFITNGAFAYGRDVTGGYGQSKCLFFRSENFSMPVNGRQMA